MPEYNVGDYLAGDAITFNGVAGEKHPGGKTYRVPAPSAEDELRLRRIVQIEDAGDTNVDLATEMKALLAGPDDTELTLPHKILGPAYDEMTADGVTPTKIDMLASLVVTNYGVSQQAAELTVAVAQGEAAARGNRATRRAAAKKTARKAAAKKTSSRSSNGKAGSRGQASRAGGAKSTPRSPATTRGSATSANTPTAATG
ncbi:hypothetical protein [uncultured Jatrophihabitans sp.]|uniref:DUF7426 family protein n=1 Tax=uncultured Jatrophihabitans sp. TaxID=1610747 RepID=UPI0035CBF216